MVALQPFLFYIPHAVRHLFSLFWRTDAEPPPSDYYPFHQNERLNGRYLVHTKLGSGVWSNTLLVTDTSVRTSKQFYAVKVLTLDATNDHRTGMSLELESMRKVCSSGRSECLPTLVDVFEIPRTRGHVHLCLVMDVYGQDIATFRRSAPQKALPVYVVKTIIKQVLLATARLHELGIVHTDIKPDNMLFRTEMTPDAIEQFVAQLPSDEDDALHPLPADFHWNDPEERIRKMNVVLTDLGQSQRIGPVGQQTAPLFGAFSLRAPEVILRSDFGPAIDIWAIGCIVFEMLSGRWLFHPEAGGDDWSIEDDHLAKMIELTNERFSAAMLERAENAREYFDSHGDLLRVQELYPVPLQDALNNYKTITADEAKAAAVFIRECLHLEPAARWSARQLLEHPWLRDL
ncbi:kinase-like protein [Phanerochaete sordida]|uniref:non-specific serine/threonine protein kinase n=1 Tax=Phanerochaete sordida TaxID=48140 RepID=A0A9P3LD66_9APHY|nr:kinase-like protein [Phanerochaete sordida]